MPPWLLGASRRARPPGLVARLLVACIACCLRDGTPAQQLEEIALESPSHLAQLWEGGLREMSRAVEAAGNPDNLPADCLRGDASAFGCLLHSAAFVDDAADTEAAARLVVQKGQFFLGHLPDTTLRQKEAEVRPSLSVPIT